VQDIMASEGDATPASVDARRHDPGGDDLDACPQPVIINEVQLILAEKRTSLATMRTGIAVCAIPLSLTGLLIATSRYYEILNVLTLFVPFGLLNAALLCLGAYLIVRSMRRLVREDRMIREIKRKHSAVAEFID
jgi:uncharacterized membrane protein YidH (DUF202 family)